MSSCIHESIQDQCIDAARTEMSESGMVSVTTYIQLTDLGLEADTIIQQLEEEN